MSLAERIRRKRLALDWSQKDLAGRLGLTQGAVAQMEAGTRSPSLETLPRLVKTLGVSADFLLFGEASERVEVGDLSLADRQMVRRFSEFLRWAKEKGM